MGEYYGVRRTDDDDRLEHIGLPKGWKKPNAKYIARLVTGYGYRYIYTPAQLAAAKAGKVANNAAKAVAGTSAYKAVRKGVNDAARSAKKSLGVYARRDMNRKWDALGSDRNPRSKAHANKFGRFMESRRAYEKTPLGRLESLKNRAIEGAQQTYYSARKSKAGRAISDAANQVGRAATNTYNAARKGVNDAGNYVNKQVKKGKKAINDYQRFRNLSDAERSIAVAADKAGMKKIKNPLNGKSYSVRGASTASKIYNMEQAIRNAPGNAARSLSDAGRKARRGAQDAWDTVSGSVNNAYKTARKTATRAIDDAGRAIDRTVGFSARQKAQATAKSAERYSHPTKKGDYRDQPNQRMGRIARDKAKKARSRYDKTLLGRAENAINSGRKAVTKAASDAGQFATKTYKNAKSQAIKTGKAVSRAADNVVGGSAKKNLKRQQDRYGNALESDPYWDYDEEHQKKDKYRDTRIKNAERAYSKAQRRYDRTLMGRVEKAREAIGSTALGAGKQINNALRTARDAGKQAGKRFSRAVDNTVGGSAKKNLKRQQGRYSKAMESEPYWDYDKEHQKKDKYRDARIKNAERAYSKAQDKYDRTLMGRAENARERANKAVGDAYTNVRNFVTPKKKKKKNSKKPATKYLKKETSASFYKNS